MQLRDLENYTSQLLEISRFRDYSPNGLQVEGRPEVRRLVSGVTACLELVEAAAAAGADALLVHHGWFWKNEDSRVVGAKKTRMELLLRHGISLLAYHLPLDAHPLYGNNAQLATLLGATVEGWFGEQGVAAHGAMEQPMVLGEWAARLGQGLGREPLVIGEPERTVRRVAWCSGGGQGYFEEAVRLGVDAFVTGEASEHNFHLARETGVAFVGAGHHATERLGVKALGEHLAGTFGLECRFVDVHNPI
ncbi:MAG: Nif3-like dinuclear metal center hexameric protein [Sulfuricellaceae bacterium]|jgi:dinuclear metal center YbgI/SA1388 family protein